MRHLAALLPLVLLASCAAPPAVAPPAGPAPAAPTPEHAWLMQLVGDWTSVSEAKMGPDAEPIHVEGSERIRALGDLWIVAEGEIETGGDVIRSRLTLGWDPARARFVGTWVDTMQALQWVYEGTLDEARRVLTLDTEGPAWDDPTKTVRYRDAIEVVDADTKVLTSSMQAADGSWTVFMRAEGRRR